MRAPFAPLVSHPAGLDQAPAPSRALRARMAAVYGVEDAALLPIVGERQARALVAQLEHAEVLELVDETEIEFADAPSRAGEAAASASLVVVRSLSLAHGLAGAPCGALIANPAWIERLAALAEPDALTAPVVNLALAVLAPAKLTANFERIARVKAERARLASELAGAPGVVAAQAEAGPFVRVRTKDMGQTVASLRRFDADFESEGAWLRLGVRLDNAALRAAFGLAPEKAARRAEVVRETSETKIVVQVDLDREAAPRIATGVGFYDHMLAQVAAHGGFALSVDCAGDLEIDTHHSIEDCALAFGAALKQALGDRKGIARFGFVLPMDETEAKVSVDLGGRPFLVFDGAFAAPLLGEYPTEMTEHVFRSLSQSMGASIHVSVTGDNDHHKTEACFKAFGRALRQAIRIEGEAVPSTKGVI
jgi:imidazoleglycerol phosphate dehydratase HisB